MSSRPLRAFERQPPLPGLYRSVSDVLLHAAHDVRGSGVRYLPADGGEPMFQPYGSLLLEARRIGAFQMLGLQPNDKVVLFLDRRRTFFRASGHASSVTLCRAAFSAGARSERITAQLARIPALLGTALLVTSKKLNGKHLARAGAPVAVVEELAGHPPVREADLRHARRDELALLVLTSGSTGSSKAVMLTHGNLLAAVAAKADREELTDRDVTLNWVAFDHVAWLLECHLLPMFVRRDADSHRAEGVPGRSLALPSGHQRGASHDDFHSEFSPRADQQAPAQVSGLLPIDLSSLRRIISGGEAVVCNRPDVSRALLAGVGLAGAPCGRRLG